MFVLTKVFSRKKCNFFIFSVGSRGCVIYNWEKLLLNFKLPNCLEMGHLVRETLAYLSTTSAKYKSIDLVDGKSLYNIAIKRTKVDRHHQLLKGDYDQGSLWIPQPFQRAKLLGIILIHFITILYTRWR